jgi:hypothetical protein
VFKYAGEVIYDMKVEEKLAENLNLATRSMLQFYLQKSSLYVGPVSKTPGLHSHRIANSTLIHKIYQNTKYEWFNDICQSQCA